jgi:outer membrane protein assembly factor BamB
MVCFKLLAPSPWGGKNLLKAGKILCLGTSLVFLQGCDKAKDPLPGLREPIIFVGEELKPDGEASSQEITLPEPVENKAWPQAGAQPNHAIPPLSISPYVQEIWRTSIGQGSSSERRLLSGPVTNGVLVFTLDTEGVVSGVDAQTGEIKWQTSILPEDLDRSLLGGGVAYDQDHVYVTSPIGEVLCLEGSKGDIIWRKSLPSPTRTPATLSQGRVFVISINNELTALDAKTGGHLWSHTGISESAGLLGGASPAVSDGVVIAPYSSGEVYALRVDNGHQLWAETFASGRRIDYVSTMAQIKARPIINKGRVYIVSNGGHMEAIDLRTGTKIWGRDVGGTRSPAVGGDFLFLITSAQDLMCMRCSDGKICWIRPLPSTEDTSSSRWGGPILVNSQLLITNSNGKALLVSAKEGQTVREFELEDPMYVSPIVANKTIYFLLDSGTLCAWK